MVSELLARCSFEVPPDIVTEHGSGRSVTCAVSGGADSLALLILAVAVGLDVVAVHVDHGLRPGSAAEADVVRDVAVALGARFRAERIDLADGPNLEARARDARRAVLPPDALTGHTADDRAETMLLNLLRGAGTTGMAGMGRSPRRPLLDLRRFETVGLCAALGLTPVCDPSNRDPRFRRNRVRHELLPLLADIGQRDPVPVLVRQADHFTAVEALVSSLATAIDPTVGRDLADAPSPVAGAAVRNWLVASGVGDGHPPDAATVERVLVVARGDAVAADLSDGWRVARTAGRLRLEPPPGRARMPRHG